MMGRTPENSTNTPVPAVDEDILSSIVFDEIADPDFAVTTWHRMFSENGGLSLELLHHANLLPGDKKYAYLEGARFVYLALANQLRRNQAEHQAKQAAQETESDSVFILSLE